MPERRTPLWLWPNLLSLDAPIVAVVWLCMFQKIWLQVLPWAYHVALFLAVWGIYIADRILDVKMLYPNDPRIGERHEFHRRHIRLMGSLAALAILGSIIVAGWHISFGPLVEYGIPAIFLTVVFFSLTIFSKQDRETPHLRNAVAGVAFAYGTAMPAHMWSMKPGIIGRVFEFASSAPLHLLTSPEMMAFAVLCILNISAIHFWEQSRATEDVEQRAFHEMVLTVPLAALGAAAIWLAALDEESRSRPFYYAVLIAAALMFVLNRRRERFSMDALRVLADAALVAPFPVFWLLSSAR